MKRKIIALLLGAALCIGAVGCTAPVSSSENPAGQEESGSNSLDSLFDALDKAKPTEEPEPEGTVGEKNALRSAKSYLDYSAFSYTGLIKQLEFEGYSNAEAVFGADNCGADWTEQAKKSAKSYLDYGAFSYTGLINQLEFEGFTEEQAKQSADSCGADWNEQATKMAQSYMDYSAFSRDGLIEQLEFEGFTAEQAEYGAKAVGY